MIAKKKCDIMLPHNIARALINVLSRTKINDIENLSNESFFVHITTTKEAVI